MPPRIKGRDMAVISEPVRSGTQTTRWIQLLLGVIAMMAISSPQYVWTLFTGPLNQRLGTTLAEIQITFSLLIVLQTFLSPFQAYLVDRFGPKLLISIGAILSGCSRAAVTRRGKCCRTPSSTCCSS